ncbi:hypothetical protein LTR70_005479 [Exophiala xenobiotica]|uniref:N-acetyltransferase domain-containing protein n=1 Tax=Lithohypha guttulata TaxID=1690604 RepID=A0ABR0KDQ3_9EURO|nr:hypothetical protein LTR24_003846 [Lithohypha guttulata]KAK5318336.1 hypothetical protein LTR70_005479 [Exophiala xenobiotica]
MSSVSGQSNATCFKTPSQFSITPVRSEEDLKDALILLYEYTKWLDLDLTFQNFDAEMANMPGKYAPPNGELFLARSPEGNAVGCVAVRPLTDAVCEMKRLWVRDSAKGIGLGKALVFAVVDAGGRLGYSKMRLDTLPRMTAAVKMYRSLGFLDIKPYYETPLVGTHFLELDLTKPWGTSDHESQGTTSEE